MTVPKETSTRETRFPRPRTGSVAALAVAALAAAGCASQSTVETDEPTTTEDDDRGGITVETNEDVVVKKYDINGDDSPDVLEFYNLVEDADNPDVEVKRLDRKKVDVNADGDFDTIRTFDEDGTPVREKIDSNLDGTFDLVLHFEEGELARKETLGSDESTIATRYYDEGELTEVERDRNGDGNVDYWEYYDDGDLQRIGRDVNGDQEIDKWIETAAEAKKTAKTKGADAPTPGEAPSSAAGGE